MEPAEEGKTGLEFINEIKGGNIPKEYIPSIEKGFKEAMKNGPLAGFEMDAMKITLKMVLSTLWIPIHCPSNWLLSLVTKRLLVLPKPCLWNLL